MTASPTISPPVVREVGTLGQKLYRLRALAAVFVLVAGTTGVMALIYHSHTPLEVFAYLFFGYLGILAFAALLLRTRPT